KSMADADKRRVGVEIGRALEHAHMRGLVHAAVKPTNVVIAADQTPVLVDFSLVRGAPPTEFAPPEHPSTMDPRADQYSLAALVSWLFIGHVPAQTETKIGRASCRGRG